MHSFGYHGDQLYCEQTNLRHVAEKFGTPLYVYSKATITDHFNRLHAALSELDHMICYAVKANSNLSVLSLVSGQGGGFDIVSAGELFRVEKAGGDPSNCTFAGVGKTKDEISYAISKGIYCFNVESEAELRYIDTVAEELGKVAPVALRVNPNVDAKTHKYISTGKSENKFGIDYEAIRGVYARAANLKNVKLKGLQMHIGSQLTSVGPFIEAVQKVAPLAAELKDNHGIEFFSVGGGIGIIYQDSLASGSLSWWGGDKDPNNSTGPSPATPSAMTIADYASAIIPSLKSLGLRILLEPGRFLVGNAGVLLTKVLYEKRGRAKTFKIIDAGMNDLLRPALYEGHHDIVPVQRPEGGAEAKTEIVDVVGPICETGDFFAQDRELPHVEEGEYLAVMSAGAYGFTMASNYNSRPLPAEILVDGEQANLVRRRQTWDDLISGEVVL